MKWFEYKAEVDTLHASNALKARLLAMQPTEKDATAPGEKEQPEEEKQSDKEKRPDALTQAPTPHKKRQGTVRFPLRQLLTAAACFAVGVAACDALGWQVIPRMGSSMNSSAATVSDAYVPEEQPAEMAMQGGWGGETTAAGAGEAGNAGGAPGAAANVGRSGAPEAAARKIIYTTELTLESKGYDDTLAALLAAANAAGGYVESSSTENYSAEQGNRYSDYTLRIPADAYESFLAAAENAGSLTYKSENAEDITARYVDVQARLDSLTSKRSRLEELEAQADTLEDLLKIEDSLADVQYEIENWQAQLKLYDDEVDYCTVHVSLREVSVYTPTKSGFFEKLGDTFVRAIGNFADGVGSFVLYLIGVWPWLVLVGAAVAAGVAYRKRRSGR